MAGSPCYGKNGRACIVTKPRFSRQAWLLQLLSKQVMQGMKLQVLEREVADRQASEATARRQLQQMDASMRREQRAAKRAQPAAGPQVLCPPTLETLHCS